MDLINDKAQSLYLNNNRRSFRIRRSDMSEKDVYSEIAARVQMPASRWIPMI